MIVTSCQRASNPVRLLAVINSRILKLGSFEDYLVEFSRRARALDWTLALLFPAIEAPDFMARLEEEGVQRHVVKGSWTSYQGILEIIALIRGFKPDIVDFHFCGTLSFLAIFLYCRLVGIAVVFHYHGEIRPICTLRWRNIHLSTMRLLSQAWTRVVTVSEANKQFLRAIKVSKPIDMVYNGIDVDRFLRRSKETNGNFVANGNDAYVNCLYIGSLIDRKKVDVLLRAFSIVTKECSTARLTVVGGGPLEGQLRKLATDLHLEEVVRFTGLTIPYPFNELKTSDVFVSASESESFGLVFAEAMSFGLPVIACKVGGIPEVVVDGVTGMLVEANDPNAFAKALLTLLKDRDLRVRMGHAGLRRVQASFRLGSTIDSTFQAFERALWGTENACARSESPKTYG